MSKSVIFENITSTDKSHTFCFLNNNFKASVNYMKIDEQQSLVEFDVDLVRQVFVLI